MDAGEVVVHVVEGNGGLVVGELLGEAVRESGKPTHLHPHREVLPLHERRGNVFEARAAADWLPAAADVIGRAVAHLAAHIPRLPIQLHQHSVIHVGPECALDGTEVSLVAVRGQLHTAAEPGLEVVDEPIGCPRVAAADIPARHQLRFGVDGHPRPHIAPALRLLLRAGVLFLGTDEAPNLVALDAFARQIHQRLALVLRARAAQVGQQFKDRRAVRASHPHGGAEAVAFHQTCHDPFTFLLAQLVHVTLYAIDS